MEIPPAKRLKISSEEGNTHDGQASEISKMVINPVAKLQNNETLEINKPFKRNRNETTEGNKILKTDETLEGNETLERGGTLVSNETLVKHETTDVIAEGSKASTSQYNYVTSEELQKLREFQVLDEVNDDDSKGEESDTSDKSEDFPDEEIEKMLEEDLPEGFKGVPKPKEKPYVMRQKIVLEEKGTNYFEVLPLDWMMVRHYSGMPVYMHRGTRVCTLSKPYFLGKGNVMRHEIPISAIPCLAYRKALEEEKKQTEIDRSIAEQIKNGTYANADQETTHLNQDIAQTNQETAQSPQETAQHNQETSQSIQETAQPKQETAQPNQETAQIKQETGQSNQNNISSDLLNGDVQLTSESLPSSQLAKDEAGNEDTEVKEQVESNSKAIQNADKAVCPFKSDKPARKPVVLPGGIVMPPPRVETVNTSWKTQHLPADKVTEYCKNLFQFKTVNVMHFKRWADRRKYVKVRKTLQYPTLPEGTKLITIPAQNSNGQENGGKATKRDWVMNMNGSSYLSVFHEYVRRALQKQPVYEFRQLENAATPYQATVYIGGMQYGVGHGSSKRQAKSAAARASIHILIPEMKDEMDDLTQQNPATDKNAEPDSFFDYVGIEDPRIQEFCTATSEPAPHAILRTCLLRNFGAGDRHINTEMKKLEYQKIELTMKVGKHSATVVCKNKKLAKQRAAQSILQQLHPHIRSWGSLLRLYGSRSVKSCKEKKLEEQQITLLQDKAQQNEPNYAVLEKLRIEMRKLRERDEAVVPIGSLLISEDLPSHSGSMLNNVDL